MKIKFLYYLTAVILLASCNTPRYVYAPSPPNTPYFREKGDAKISGYYSIGASEENNKGERNNGYDVQAAYAITDNWALTFDHFYRKEKDIYDFYEYSIFDNSVVRYKRNITSIGAGYFKGMNRRRTVTFNIYGGIGWGKFSINDKGIDDTLAVYARFHKANVTKWYLQPGFNFMPRNNAFRSSVTTRFVFTKYAGVITSYDEYEQETLDLKKLNGRVLTFFEPAYNMEIGVPHCPWLKLNAGIAFSVNIRPETDEYGTYYDSRGLTASFGVTFVPSKLKEK